MEVTRRSLFKTMPAGVLALALTKPSFAATSSPPLIAASQSVAAFFTNNVTNLYRKLAAHHATAEDFGLASAATGLWFNYLADLGYTPMLSDFIKKDVLVIPLFEYQGELYRGRMGFLSPPILVTDGQFKNFVYLADAHFAAAQDAFVREGTTALSNALINVLDKGAGQISTAPALSFGLANQFVGSVAARCMMEYFPGGIPWLTGSPGLINAMTTLVFILGILGERAAADRSKNQQS